MGNGGHSGLMRMIFNSVRRWDKTGCSNKFHQNTSKTTTFPLNRRIQDGLTDTQA